MKMTKEERREQREKIEERMRPTVSVRICLCIELSGRDNAAEVLDLYDRAVARDKGTRYRLDNWLWHGGKEKHDGRARRRGK